MRCWACGLEFDAGPRRRKYCGKLCQVRSAGAARAAAARRRPAVRIYCGPEGRDVAEALAAAAARHNKIRTLMVLSEGDDDETDDRDPAARLRLGGAA